jgi:hypothetical protein
MFKIISRTFLGIGIAFALSAVAFGYDWWSELLILNAAFLIIFLLLLVTTLRFRQRHLDVPCLRCSEGRFPFCSWRADEIRNILRRYEREPTTMPATFASFLYAVEEKLANLDAPAALSTVEFITTDPQSAELKLA